MHDDGAGPGGGLWDALRAGAEAHWLNVRALPLEFQAALAAILAALVLGPPVVWWNNARANRLARARDAARREAEDRVEALAEARRARDAARPSRF